MKNQKTSGNYTVMIADDHPLVRNSLKQIIRKIYPDFEVLYTNTMIKLIDLLKTNSVDFLLLDVMLDDGISLGNIETLRKIRPELKILVLSHYSTEQFGKKALELGADGYIEKNASMSELVKALNAVLEDDIYFKPEALLNLAFNRKFYNNPFDMLTKREFEVAVALLQAKRRDQIANELKIKVNTISMHKAKIFEKLKISSILSLKELAQKNNILENLHGLKIDQSNLLG